MMEESPVEQTADVGFELSRAGLPSVGQYSSKELQKSTYGLESNLLNQMQYGLDALDSSLTFLSENPKLLNEQIKLKAPNRNSDDYHTDPSTALAYDAAGLVIQQVTGPNSKKLSDFFDQKAPKAKKIIEQVVAQLKQHSSEIDSMNDAVRIVLQGDFSKLSYKDLLDLINSHLEFYQKSELEAELQRLGIPKDLSTELKDFVSAQFESDDGDFEVIKELFFVLRNVGMAHNIAEKFCYAMQEREIIAQMGEHHTRGVEFLLKKVVPKERLSVARDATTFLEFDTEQRLNHLKKSTEEIQTAK